MKSQWWTVMAVLVVLVVVVLTAVSDAQNRNTRNRSRNRASSSSRTRTRTGTRNNNNNNNNNNNDNNSDSDGNTRGNNRRRQRERTRPSNPSSGAATTSGTGGRSRSRSRGNRRGGSSSRHSSCEEIYLPMCKGLISYTHTKLPNMFNHTTQAEVYRVLEHKWAHMDHSCSSNLRHMVCSLYLPKCHGRGPGLGPCKRTCMSARRKCVRPFRDFMGITWADQYDCGSLTNRRCLRPIRETRCPFEYPTCVENSQFPVCANLTFNWGTLPNMFQQCHVQEINTEVEYYTPLLETNCHPNLNFFLCGVYSPFCVRNEVPFTFPCRELCEEIRTSCEPHYRRLYHNLRWPNKLQCHRYPSTLTEGYNCVMPNEGGINAGGKK